MRKDNLILLTLISAAFITASYTYLSYGMFVVADYLSLTTALLSLGELMDFVYILVGVLSDRLAQKLRLRDRLIALTCLVVIPALIFKFIL